jgi:hypothetical protein
MGATSPVTQSHPRRLDLPGPFSTSDPYLYVRNTAVKVSVENRSDALDVEMVTHTQCGDLVSTLTEGSLKMSTMFGGQRLLCSCFCSIR